MKKLLIAVLAAVATMGITMTASAAGDAAAGKAMYGICASCHGMAGEGNQALNAPALAGLPAWYTALQINNFKAGIRGADPKDTYGVQMRPMAMTLADDAAVNNVSAYIATLTPAKPAGTVTGDAAAGAASYALCASCHGAMGEGNDALKAPKLAGQSDWYIVRQLQNFKAGVRGANPKDAGGMQMRPMAMTLATDDMIKNVAAHIATFK